MTRSDLLRVRLRPAEEIHAEIEAAVVPRVRGADPGRLVVGVRDGVVSVPGRIEYRSAIAGLIRGIQEVEDVVGIDQDIAYDLDDQYPVTSAGF